MRGARLQALHQVLESLLTYTVQHLEHLHAHLLALVVEGSTGPLTFSRNVPWCCNYTRTAVGEGKQLAQDHQIQLTPSKFRTGLPDGQDVLLWELCAALFSTTTLFASTSGEHEVWYDFLLLNIAGKRLKGDLKLDLCCLHCLLTNSLFSVNQAIKIILFTLWLFSTIRLTNTTTKNGRLGSNTTNNGRLRTKNDTTTRLRNSFFRITRGTCSVVDKFYSVFSTLC